jgi:hypothetical protein
MDDTISAHLTNHGTMRVREQEAAVRASFEADRVSSGRLSSRHPFDEIACRQYKVSFHPSNREDAPVSSHPADQTAGAIGDE